MPSVRVFPDHADCSGYVLQCLILQRCIEQHVHRICQYKGLIAFIPETVCNRFSLRRRYKAVPAARYHQNAGTRFCIFMQIRYNIRHKSVCHRIIIFIFSPKGNCPLIHICSSFPHNPVSDFDRSSPHTPVRISLHWCILSRHAVYLSAVPTSILSL